MLVLGCFRDVAPFAVALAIGVGTVACIPREPTAPKEGKIRLMTGLIGSGYYGLGQAMARAYAIAHPAVELEVIEGTGSVSTVEAIQSGDADVGFTLADVAYLAFTAPMHGLHRLLATVPQRFIALAILLTSTVMQAHTTTR